MTLLYLGIGLAFMAAIFIGSPIAWYVFQERQDRLRGERWMRNNPNGGRLNLRFLDRVELPE